MEKYEKTLMEVVELDNAHIVTESCPDEFEPCDDELPILLA